MQNFTGSENTDHPGPFPTSKAVYVALNICLSITASFGNALILIALRKVESIHPPTKLLLRCLAITDLCVGLISEQLFVIRLVLPYVPRLNQSIISYFSTVRDASGILLGGISIFISTAISVDRLLALVMGLRYRQVVTLTRVRVVTVCLCLIGVTTGLLNVFRSHLISWTVALAFVILSLFISVFSYTKIFFRLRQHQAQVQDHLQQGQPNGGEVSLNIARYKKTVSSIAWVQLALLFCYVPFSVGSIISLTRRRRISNTFWFPTITLFYSNSSLNPILYCWKISEVRQAVKDTIRQLCCLSG